jgi:hypothetical protein
VPPDPQILLRDPIMGPILPHKIAERYDSSNPFKKVVTDVLAGYRALAENNFIISILFK